MMSLSYETAREALNSLHTNKPDKSILNFYKIVTMLLEKIDKRDLLGLQALSEGLLRSRLAP